MNVNQPSGSGVSAGQAARLPASGVKSGAANRYNARSFAGSAAMRFADARGSPLQTLGAILVLQSRDLRVDRLLGLALHVADRRPVHEVHEDEDGTWQNKSA